MNRLGNHLLRILLVDDSATFAEVVKVVLEQHGILCDVAEDGQAALAMAHLADYALFLVDYVLPDTTGVDVVHALGPISNAPKWILTGHTELAKELAGSECGASRILLKPLELKELAEHILSQGR